MNSKVADTARPAPPLPHLVPNSAPGLFPAPTPAPLMCQFGTSFPCLPCRLPNYLLIISIFLRENENHLL